MSRHPRVRWLALALLALLVVVTACGGQPQTAAPSQAPTQAPAAKPTEAPKPAATTAPAAAPTQAPTQAPAAAKPTDAPKPTEAAKTTTSGAASPGVTDSEIVIGSWGPQDGPAGAYGVIDRTLAAYFKKVNEEGGVNGRKVRFIYENDSYAPAKTVAAVKKLVEEDKVFALVGGLGTANNLAVTEYLVQNNVPHLSPNTGSTAVVKPLKKGVFGLQLDYTTEATLLTQYALDTLKSQKIAVFYQNDQFGKEGLDGINAELKKRNLPEATLVSYEPTDTNFSAQALKLQTTGADTVILYAVPKPGASIIAEMTKIGFKPKTLSSAVINDPSLFQLAGPGAEGLIIAAWLPDYKDTSNPKIAEYQAFMQKYAANEQIGSFSLVGYTQGQLATEALKRAGKDLTRDGFIKALEGMQDWKGSVAPSITYSATEHQGVKTAYFQQAKNNVFVNITDFITMK